MCEPVPVELEQEEAPLDLRKTIGYNDGEG